MKRLLKRIFITALSLLVLIIAALLITPFFIDAQQYRPVIESRVSDITGRPFTLRGIRLSLFPRASLSLSDARLQNPPGFETTDFLSVKFLEVRVDLLPLLSKELRITRFSLKNPIITLIRNRRGVGNWEGIVRAGKEEPIQRDKKKAPSGKPPVGGWSLGSLAVKTFTLSEGILLWIDRMNGERKEIRDLAVNVKDLSLSAPVLLQCSATIDQHPVSLHGTVGPIGKNPGKGTVPVDLSVGLLKEAEMHIQGKIVDPEVLKDFDLRLQIQPFSPRKVFRTLERPFPIETPDVEALNSASLVCRLQGDSKSLSLSDGSLSVDQTRMSFSAKLTHFSGPEIAFDVVLDRLDVDHYLPRKGKKEQNQEPVANQKKVTNTTSSEKKSDRNALQSLTLNGAVFVKALKIKGANLQDVQLTIKGKNGLFQLQPFHMKLYGGEMTGAGILNQKETPLHAQIQCKAEGIRVGPMIRDISGKDFMEGLFSMDAGIDAVGDSNEDIRKSLHGEGAIRFKDGVIRGIDLPAMLQNPNLTHVLSGGADRTALTSYSEINIPFTIANGMVQTTKTTLVSPVLKVEVKGHADLAEETLDFRIEPLFLTPMKGQGEGKGRKGIAIPVLVGGTFSSPRFIPDLNAILKQNFGKEVKGLPELQKNLLQGGGKDGKDSPMDKIRDFLNKLR